MILFDFDVVSFTFITMDDYDPVIMAMNISFLWTFGHDNAKKKMAS